MRHHTVRYERCRSARITVIPALRVRRLRDGGPHTDPERGSSQIWPARLSTGRQRDDSVPWTGLILLDLLTHLLDNPPFGQPTFWTTHLLDNPPFGQPTFWTTHLLDNPPFGQPTFWTTHLLDNPPFGQPTFWTTHLLDNPPFGQPTFWTTHLFLDNPPWCPGSKLDRFNAVLLHPRTGGCGITTILDNPPFGQPTFWTTHLLDNPPSSSFGQPTFWTTHLGYYTIGRIHSPLT